MMVTLGMLSDNGMGTGCVGSDWSDPDCVRSAERWFDVTFWIATVLPLVSAVALWRTQRSSDAG
jgi:hypothetical protein